MSAGMLAVGEAAIQVTADFRHIIRALERLNADLRKFKKQTDIHDRRTRRAVRQANRRPALIHNGGKP